MPFVDLRKNASYYILGNRTIQVLSVHYLHDVACGNILYSIQQVTGSSLARAFDWTSLYLST